jgi:hypothetical protein
MNDDLTEGEKKDQLSKIGEYADTGRYPEYN